MRVKAFFLYTTGIVLLLFGNRQFWDKLQQNKEEQQKLQALAQAGQKVKTEVFETQKLQYDSISKKWKNPQYYFQVINAGNPNFKALKKGKTTVATNTDEDASNSQ